MKGNIKNEECTQLRIGLEFINFRIYKSREQTHEHDTGTTV